MWSKTVKYLLYNTKRTFCCVRIPTIFALSSGHGKCGVAVIRVSGADSKTALRYMTHLDSPPKPRTAILKSIRNPSNGEIIDKGLILWFPAPRSFTGEDCIEFQVHGGIAVINSILHALGTIPNLRLAEPGEFTRRAFFNAKLDLTEVEGLADLLQAETEAQRKQAFLQSQGSLSKLYKKWKNVLIHNVAHVEAYIDFDETETLDLNMLDSVKNDIKILANDIEKHLTDGRKGEILRNGVRTVIMGEPNVGKSSLLNLLCSRPVAIVTPVEGTTRDILEITLNIDGYPLILADTAGLRSVTADIVEKEGISRALQLYKKSDLIILLLDSEKYFTWKKHNINSSFKNYVMEYIKQLKLMDLIEIKDNGSEVNFEFLKPCIIVMNKSDLSVENVDTDLENFVNISCITKYGVTSLIEKISNNLKHLCGEPSEEHPSMNQTRHRQHLNECLKNLKLFLDKNNDYDLVLSAEHLRIALKHLGKLVGTVTTDELLNVIFQDFCIGK